MFSSLPCFCTSYMQVYSYLWLIFTEDFLPLLTVACFFAARQQTHCSVPAHTYLLSLSRSIVVLLINFNFSVCVLRASIVTGKTLQHVGSYYGLQQLVSHDIGLSSYKTVHHWQ